MELRGQVTVLVVEDEALVLSTTAESLVDDGYRVLTAINARAALEILDREQPVDILFTDIVMPGGMNGVELALEARRRYPKISVLLTSGYAASAMDLMRGRDDLPLLSKPYVPAQLPARFAALGAMPR